MIGPTRTRSQHSESVTQQSPEAQQRWRPNSRLPHPFGSSPSGFTLLELLVVLVIVGILLGILFPAVQHMRELSRRSHCEQNLVQLSLGLSQYSTSFKHYPVGTRNPEGPIRSEPKGYHHNWISAVLPKLNIEDVFEMIDFNVGVYAPENKSVRAVSLPAVLCPSASNVASNTTCYAGIHASSETPIDRDNDGCFILNKPIRDRDIPDGIGFTLFLGEKLSAINDDLGWMSGTRSSLRNTGHPLNQDRLRLQSQAGGQETASPGPLFVGGLSSDHPGGAYVLLGGGEYQFLSDTVDQTVLRQLASRNDGSTSAEGATEGGQEAPSSENQATDPPSDDQPNQDQPAADQPAA